MSHTPRTDKAALCWERDSHYLGSLVNADFARELERELADWKRTAFELVTDGNAVTLAQSLQRMEGENAKLRADKARYEFCKRHMMVGTHGLAPGVTDINMVRVPIDCVLGGADEIIDRAMLPGTAANVQRMIDNARV